MARTAGVTATATAAALLASFASLAAARAAAALNAAPAIAKAADGHYWATADIQGRPLRVLVDTGATAVALTAADARSLGLAPERLAYTRRLSTASGAVRAAAFRAANMRGGRRRWAARASSRCPRWWWTAGSPPPCWA